MTEVAGVVVVANVHRRGRNTGTLIPHLYYESERSFAT